MFVILTVIFVLCVCRMDNGSTVEYGGGSTQSVTTTGYTTDNLLTVGNVTITPGFTTNENANLTSELVSIATSAVLTSDSRGLVLYSTIMEVANGVKMALDDGYSLNYTNGTDWLNDNVEGNATLLKPYENFYETARFVTGLICYPIICFYGLIGNILILVVLAQKSMDTSTNVYLSAMAVSDIVKMVNDLLYFLTILLYHTNPVAGNKCFGYLYPYAHFFFNMSVCVSSWLTVSVAVERYLLVCHPIRSKTVISIAKAKVISIVCFVIMTAVAIPSALRYETIDKTVFQDGKNITELDVVLTSLWKENTFLMSSYNWLQSLLRSIIPLFILAVMNAFIINALRKTRASKRNNSRNKITIMLIVVIIFFLICIIPDAVMSAFFNLGYAEVQNFLVRGVREITDMLLAINAAINFTLYMIFNKIFRDQFMALFCKRFRKSETEDAQYRRLAESKPTTAHSNGVQKGRKTQQSTL